MVAACRLLIFFFIKHYIGGIKQKEEKKNNQTTGISTTKTSNTMDLKDKVKCREFEKMNTN